MMKYPIGIQSFEKIRINDFVYVDKTALVYDLVSTSAVCFLSRPAVSGKAFWSARWKTFSREERAFPRTCHREIGEELVCAPGVQDGFQRSSL